MAVTSQHLGATIDKAVSATMAVTTGANPATEKTTSFTGSETVPMLDAGAVKFASLTNLASILSGLATWTEEVQDLIGSLLSAADASVVVTYDDVGDALTVAHGDTSSVSDVTGTVLEAVTALAFDTYGHVTTATKTDLTEAVDDRVAALLSAGTYITLTYTDASGDLEIGTDLSTFPGTTAITTLGTIATGTWEGTAIQGAQTDIDLAEITDVTITAVGAGELLKWSGSAWVNNTLAEAGIAAASALTSHTGDTANPHTVTQAQVGLSAVENTALSTWAGSANITTLGSISTLGTISTGTWQGGIIDHERGGLEADVSAYDGFLRITGGATSAIKCKFDATADPTSTDDSAAGYAVGSTWINVTADTSFICVDSTATAAVWVLSGQTGVVSALNDLSDVVITAAGSDDFLKHNGTNFVNTDFSDAVAAAGAMMDADISEGEGFLRKTGAGAYEGIKSNLSASTAPTTGDDTLDGYAVGSIWIDTTADAVYQCLDATAAAAVWGQLNVEGGGLVLQVVGAVDSTTTAHSTSWGDTGASISITPSSTASKILVMANVPYYWQAETTYQPEGHIGLFRDSTSLMEMRLGSYHQNNYRWIMGSASFVYLDSPSSTSALTYKSRAKKGNSYVDILQTEASNEESAIVAIEISG